MINPESGFTADVIRETERFVGRSAEVQSCIRAINNPLGLIAVYGKRGVGKSSILRQLQQMALGDYSIAQKAGVFHEVPQEPRKYLTVYYQCDAMIRDTPALLSRLCNDQDDEDGLLRLIPNEGKEIVEFTRTKEVSGGADLKVVSWGAKGVESSKYARVVPNDIAQTFRNFVQAIVSTQVRGRMKRDALLILLDEFDVIEDKRAFGSLIKSMTSRDVKFGICGIARDLHDLVEDHSSVERLLEEGAIHVKRMSHDETEMIFYTAERLFEKKITFDRKVVRRIAAYSDGYPYLAQLFGKECTARAVSAGVDCVKEDILESVLQDIREGRAFPTLERAYQTAIGNSEDRKILLHFLAEQESEESLFKDEVGRVYLKKLRNDIEIKYTDQLVPRLVEKKYGPVLYRVPERPGVYEFANPVLRLYIRLRNF